MSLPTTDTIRRIELTLLVIGAVIAAAGVVVGSMDFFARVQALSMSDLTTLLIAGLKLLLVEAAVLAPFVVLAMLSHALMRESPRRRYRIAGLSVSLITSLAVCAWLLTNSLSGIDSTLMALTGLAAPALLILAMSAAIYGILIWSARHAVLERSSN